MMSINAVPPVPGVSPLRLLRLPEVLNLTGLSRTTLYRLAANGEFPEPRRIAARAVAWPSSEVEQWIAARVA